MNSIKLIITLLTCLIASSSFAAGMITVPAGSFNMGCSSDDKACGGDEGPAGGVSVNVPAFSLDINEVTVAEYRACLDSGNCARPDDYARNQYCNLDAPNRDKHPMNCVDWQDAKNYCSWKDKRLPTEAEWEKAARAGTQSRYPWGQAVSCKQAILDDGKTRGSKGDELDGCGEDRTWNIASRSANALGLYDMHGNAGEWTATWYAPDAIKSLYATGKLAGPENGKQRVVRGGSWDENVNNLRSSYRNVKPPVSGQAIYGSIGFRCAK